MNFTEANTEHYAEVLKLNDAAVPNVNRLSLQDLERLARQAKLFLVAIDDAENVAGFILTLDESADYDSPNFRFFQQEFERFLYVDRIVIDSTTQRSGVGSQLYTEINQRLGDQYPLLTCEVNIEPPNPQSMNFHRRLGFVGVGEQDTENDTKRVLLMSKLLGELRPV